MFSFFNETAITPETIIIPIAIGVVLAALVTIFCKQTAGKFVIRLIREDAKDESSARGLDELGFSNNLFVKLALNSGGTYSKIVKRCADGIGAGAGAGAGAGVKTAKRADVLSGRYYVEERDVEKAELIYSIGRTPMPIILIALMVFLLVIAVLLHILPNFGNMIASLGEQISSTFKK